MSKFYAEDNPFNAALTKIFDLCVLNMVTLLCCVPVVTAGAALTAMYAVMLPMSENKEGPVVKTFFKEFRANLKDSVMTWLCVLAGVLLLLFDLYVWTKVESQYRSVFFGLTIAMLVALVVVAGWYFALRATFDDNGKTSLMNAAKYTMVYLPASVLMGAYTAVLMYVYLNQGFIAMLTPIFGLTLVEYPKAWYMRQKFNAYIEEHSDRYHVEENFDETFMTEDDLETPKQKTAKPEDAQETPESEHDLEVAQTFLEKKND
jgi:uncharacterized membrane protein YesL